MNKMKVASVAVAMTVLGLGLAACGNQTSKDSAAKDTSSKVVSTSNANSTSSASTAASSSTSSTATSTPKDTTVDNKTVGVMVALLENPDWFKEYLSSGTMHYGSNYNSPEVQGFNYLTTNGDQLSYIFFKQEGNNVIIKQWTDEGADMVAHGHYETTTVSLDRLKQDYYVTDAQKAEVQGYVNELKE